MSRFGRLSGGQPLADPLSENGLRSQPNQPGSRRRLLPRQLDSQLLTISKTSIQATYPVISLRCNNSIQSSENNVNDRYRQFFPAVAVRPNRQAAIDRDLGDSAAIDRICRVNEILQLEDNAAHAALG